MSVAVRCIELKTAHGQEVADSCWHPKQPFASFAEALAAVESGRCAEHAHEVRAA